MIETICGVVSFIWCSLKGVNVAIQIGELKAYNADELAEILKVHPRTARNYLKDGRIPGAKKIGGKWYITERQIQVYLESNGTS